MIFRLSLNTVPLRARAHCQRPESSARVAGAPSARCCLCGISVVPLFCLGFFGALCWPLLCQAPAPEGLAQNFT